MFAIRPIQLSILERDSCRRLALTVLAELRTASPHAVGGLSASEIDCRLDAAIAKAARHQLNSHDDVRAYIRLSLTIGPLFDEYPPFKEILSSHGNDVRILALFALAAPGDWNSAAQFDIVSRYRKAIPGIGPISLAVLEDRHADSYFRHARHPDVWRLARMKPMATAADALQLIGTLGPAKTGYAVVDQQDRFLGAIFAYHDETATRVSYWIARHAWGQGIASQALMQLRRAQQTKNWMLTIEPGNLPSLKVANKCGFLQTDTFTFVA